VARYAIFRAEQLLTFDREFPQERTSHSKSAPVISTDDHHVAVNPTGDELCMSSLFKDHSRKAVTINVKVRTDPNDTRERIAATAQALFRRLGFTKTTVADIAAELQMSPANVYRFFPSKNAIVQATCTRCLSEIQTKASAVARSNRPAIQRMERLVLEILGYHRANLARDQHVNELVIAAIEHNWDAIRAHKDVLRHVTELILRDGIAADELEPLDPRETANLILRSVVAFIHPLLVGQSIREGLNIEIEARACRRFLLCAITPRQPRAVNNVAAKSGGRN
jgi:AcrR family transcriptional regulator